jgi:hypothetical protein
MRAIADAGVHLDPSPKVVVNYEFRGPGIESVQKEKAKVVVADRCREVQGTCGAGVNRPQVPFCTEIAP